jgi:hypothetical protein
MEDRGVSDVIYLYGFVPADSPAPPPALAGIGDHAVELLPFDGLAAVISRLPLEDYDPARIEARLEDLGWVGSQGLAHERVVLWFVDHADILPARLFSLHSGEAALRASLGPAAAGIAQQLAQLAGRHEWNLKVAYDADELGRHGGEVSDELRRLDAEIDSAPPGRRYLLERRRADTARRELGRSAHRLATELLDALRPHAEAVRLLPLGSGAEVGTVVLNTALLVRRGDEAALRDVAEQRMVQLRPLGMLPNLSGPWAPYRFLEDDDDV